MTMPEWPRVDILLSTYNGVVYLPELLVSLVAQDYPNLSVLVRDDGSSDDTVALLQTFAAAHPRLQVQLFVGEGNLGPARSFLALMQRSQATYMACADQDDVWHAGKVSALVRALAHAEGEHGASVPMLAHCDLRVVDKGGALIAPSFWAFSELVPDRNRLRDLLVANTVTGCAMLVNRAARDHAVSVSMLIYMHDHWLALICALAGRIVVVDAPLLDYRQHGGNVVGANNHRWWSLVVGRLRRLRMAAVPAAGLPLQGGRQDARYHLARFAEALLQLDLDWRSLTSQRRLLEDLVCLPASGRLRRWIFLLSRGLWSRPLIKNYAIFF
jgi:glycosyltransferase involved in cell wall biosynthesis